MWGAPVLFGAKVWSKKVRLIHGTAGCYGPCISALVSFHFEPVSTVQTFTLHSCTVFCDVHSIEVARVYYCALLHCRRTLHFLVIPALGTASHCKAMVFPHFCGEISLLRLLCRANVTLGLP